MSPAKIAAILLIIGGALGLVYGGFTYTSDTHRAPKRFRQGDEPVRPMYSQQRRILSAVRLDRTMPPTRASAGWPRYRLRLR